MLVGTKKMIAIFTNASDGAPIELDLKGNFWGGSAEIDLGGRTVATISRQVANMREMFADKQTCTCPSSSTIALLSRT